jgi:hypothetical protein
MEIDMAIWRLTPVDVDDPSWEASSHRGHAIVRADTEDAARAIAQHAFGVKTGFRPRRGSIVSPWKRTELVQVEHVKDPRFEEDGPDEVLMPIFDADLHTASRRS